MATKTKKAQPKLKAIKNRDELLEALSGCSLTFGWWGILKMVGREQQEAAAKAIDADRKAVKTQKVKIDLNMPEWKDLQALRSSITGWYNFRTFDYCVRGQRLFHREMREEIWNGVKEHQAALEEASKRLQQKRADVIAWAKKTLGQAFNNKDYPDTFAGAFVVQIREHSINPPDYLRTEDEREYQRHQQQTVRDINLAMERFEAQCANRVLSAVQKVNEVLQAGDAPRPQTIETIRNAFDRVAKMKFRGTAAFESCKKDVESLINGVSIKDIRRMHGAHEEAKEKFAALLKRHQELLNSVATMDDVEE
jgi:hypothetical protein